MTAVEKLDAAGLLYLCSRIRALDSKNFKMRGCYPSNSEVVSLMREAGFDEWVVGLPASRGPVSLKLESGYAADQIDPRGTPSRIQSFITRAAPDLDLETKDVVFTAIQECLENVRKHAYGPRPKKRPDAMWHVVGRTDPISRTSTVAIIDSGVGIMQTVKRKFIRGEIIGSAMDALRMSSFEYLAQASLGLRTHSREPKHGKGLRDLKEFASAQAGRRLHIVSSDARIMWSKEFAADPLKIAMPGFIGTMICLEIDGSSA